MEIEITEEIPFSLSEKAEYVRLKELWELISGRDLAPDEYNDKNSGIPYITGASNFDHGSILISRWTDMPQVITYKGDLLLTCKGTIGEMAFNIAGDAHIARQIMAIRDKYNLNIKYLSLCIAYYVEAIKTAAKGLIPGISREDILELLIPIYPLHYQEQVVEKVNNLYSILDTIEKGLN